MLNERGKWNCLECVSKEDQFNELDVVRRLSQLGGCDVEGGLSHECPSAGSTTSCRDLISLCGIVLQSSA
jgi:hypothetical protein